MGLPPPDVIGFVEAYPTIFTGTKTAKLNLKKAIRRWRSGEEPRVQKDLEGMGS